MTANANNKLVLAIIKGDLADVKAALNEGASPNARNKWGYSAFDFAFFNLYNECTPEIIKCLIAAQPIENPETLTYPSGDDIEETVIELLSEAGIASPEAVWEKRCKVHFPKEEDLAKHLVWTEGHDENLYPTPFLEPFEPEIARAYVKVSCSSAGSRTFVGIVDVASFDGYFDEQDVFAFFSNGNAFSPSDLQLGADWKAKTDSKFGSPLEEVFPLTLSCDVKLAELDLNGQVVEAP